MNVKEQSIVLFLPLSKANLLEMLPIAHAMQSTNTHKPIFCLDKKIASLVTLLDSVPAIRSDGTPLVLSAPKEAAPVAPLTSRKEKIFSALPFFFRSLLLLRAECLRAKKLLSTIDNVSLIIISGDRSIGIETAVIAEANTRNIPSLIVPFAMSYREAAAEPRLRSGKKGGQYALSTPQRYLLKLLFPSWIFVHKNTPLFFQSPFAALAAYVLGIMPKNPWIIGGGAASKMAVESEALRNQLLEQGMAADKMIVTGKPSLDAIVGELHSKKDTTEKKAILCSVPQLAEHDLLPWDKHEEEMRFLFKTLAATKATILLSLHPRSDRAWYEPLANEAGLQIAEERMYTLLPSADIVTSIYASVIAQGIALGKPCVIADLYGLDYPVYDGAPGTAIIKEKDKLLPHFERLLHDDEYYNSCVQDQKDHGSEWALLDGNNTKRVLELITKLTT